MSATSQREYYRQYMRKYYQEHKDYWHNYYLQRKRPPTKRSKGSQRSRRHYLERIGTAWLQEHVENRPLSRLFRRLSRTTVHDFYSDQRRTRPQRKGEISKTWAKPAHQLTRILPEILKKEDFAGIQLPTSGSGEHPDHHVSTFQALAIRDNKRCIIEVSTKPFKLFTAKRKEYLRALLNFFDAGFFLCFIKPDLSRYHLMELESSKIRSVTLGLKAIAAMKQTPPLT